jgi:hypothetical protein
MSDLSKIIGIKNQAQMIAHAYQVKEFYHLELINLLQ